ncbi:MAG: N-acetylglucosamine kinase [Labedaea sp.]
MSHVVGVDVGGTSTRALALGLDGTPLGRGRAGGGNPNSHPPELAAKRLAEAVAAALDAVAAADTRHCLLGVAGASKLSDPAVSEVFHANLGQVGLRCPVTVLSDAEVAFASATSAPAGTVLIGGTGSIAVRIADRRRTSVVGGYGWLLGDEGSAFWIGREAVRSALGILLRGTELGPLAAAVLAEALGESWRTASYGHLITAANAEPPVRLARFAALVAAHAATDPEAARIVREAAELLAEQAVAATEPGSTTPVVLVGSVVGPGSPVGERLRTRLTELIGAEVLFAADPAAGAAWLAAIEVLGPDAPRPQVST